MKRGNNQDTPVGSIVLVAYIVVFLLLVGAVFGIAVRNHVRGGESSVETTTETTETTTTTDATETTASDITETTTNETTTTDTTTSQTTTAHEVQTVTFATSSDLSSTYATSTTSTTSSSSTSATAAPSSETSTTTTTTAHKESPIAGLTYLGNFTGTYYRGATNPCRGGSGRTLIDCAAGAMNVKGSVACKYIYANYGYYVNDRTKVYIEVPSYPSMTGWYYVDDCCASYSVVDFYYPNYNRCPFQNAGVISVKLYI